MNATRFGVGSLIQINARGPQDVPIHDDAETWKFQQTYETHTHFQNAHLTIGYNVDGISLFNKKCVIELPKLTHLVHILKYVYLEVHLGDLNNILDEDTDYRYQNNIAHNLIKEYSIKINGNILCKYSGDYLHIHNLLNENQSVEAGVDEMIGRQKSNNPRFLKSDKQKLFIPIPIFLNDANLPLCSLLKSEIQFEILFNDLNEVICDIETPPIKVTNEGKVVDISKVTNIKHFAKLVQKIKYEESEYDFLLHLDGYTLQDNEKFMFMHTPFQTIYSIPKYITNRITSSSPFKVYLEDFQLPVSKLIWFVHENEDASSNYVYYDNGTKFIENFFTFSLNNTQIVIDDMKYIHGKNTEFTEYYRYIQPYYHSKCIVPNIDDYIYEYSFALNNSHHSGSLDFSKIKTKYLEIFFNNNELKDKYISVYAICTNVLNIENEDGVIQFI